MQHTMMEFGKARDPKSEKEFSWLAFSSPVEDAYGLVIVNVSRKQSLHTLLIQADDVI